MKAAARSDRTMKGSPCAGVVVGGSNIRVDLHLVRRSNARSILHSILPIGILTLLLSECGILTVTDASATPASNAGSESALGPSTESLLHLDTTSATNPTDDSVILYRGVYVRLDPDGRIQRRVRQVERLLTDHAVTLRGDQRVAYDVARQELAIHVCRTFMRDGKEVVALPRAFNLTTPERVAACPDRTDLQEMVISLLGVETGCLIELDYTVRDQAPWRPWLEGIEAIGAEAPIFEAETVIELPPGAPFHAAMVENGASLPADGERNGEMRTFRWARLPARPEEGGSPAILRIPQFVFSTCAGWDALTSWIEDRITAAAVPDAAIRAWCTEDLPGGRPPLDADSRLERVAALLGEGISEADDRSLDWWLPVRPAARTFDVSCGNLLDRAALAMASMDAMGMEGRLTLRPSLAAAAHGDPSLVVPALAQFDDIWLAVGTDILDVGEATFGARPDPGLAEAALSISAGGSAFVPLAGRRGTSFLSLHLSQKDDGTIVGDALARIGGSLVRSIDALGLAGVLDDLAGRCVQDASIEGRRVLTLTPDTLAVTFSFSGSGLGDSLGDGRRRFEIPSGPGLPDGGLPDHLSLRRLTRTTPIFLPGLVAEDVSVRLDLPADCHPLILPSPVQVTGGGASIETLVERDGRRIILRRHFEISERTVPPEEYAGFRATVLERIESPANAVYLGGRIEKP